MNEVMAILTQVEIAVFFIVEKFTSADDALCHKTFQISSLKAKLTTLIYGHYRKVVDGKACEEKNSVPKHSFKARSYQHGTSKTHLTFSSLLFRILA